MLSLMGRHPSKNPKGIHLGIRIDEATAKALDREIRREVGAKPGLTLSRSAMVRILMAEALLARSRQRHR